jgi:hypothetical protein
MKPGVRVILTLAALIACGCGTTAAERSEKAKSSLTDCQRQAQAWVGKTEIDLLKGLGPPARSSSDGKTGKILEWRSDVDLGKQESVGAFSSTWTQYILTIKSDYFLDENGRVYLANCLDGGTTN